ncbi:GIY-YIG nuclease family protein [Thioclava nitratireducens]|uniref:GIY-YIG nuclease family protein n=1 Tax=Thioclava nitratireducens TaxID=1915078 RepID=UPI00248028F6|nr:GIY-YIG nuclease family protein [Thioclava nitratireducens]WGT50454.1 hypothetical protein P0N61_00035 [Thioclava nitratireducens]
MSDAIGSPTAPQSLSTETRFKLYVIRDPRLPDACKIGKDTNWPKRYQQALCHSPAPLKVVESFSFSDSVEVKQAEKDASRLLAHFKRSGDVNEWYDLPAHGSLEQLKQKFSGWQVDQTSTTQADVARRGKLPYDDWRDYSNKWRECRWHFWLFRERKTNGRWKLICSSLYDTFYRYSFTYNPYPVRLMAAFEAVDGIDNVALENRRANDRLIGLWEDLMMQQGILESFQVGWLPPEVCISQFMKTLEQSGMRPVDLARPKPPFVRPRDSSIRQVPVGTVPPLYRLDDGRINL